MQTAVRQRIDIQQKPYSESLCSDEWSPNIPFHGTQEEWWQHFHQIEKGQFYPISDVHQRIAQWMDEQK